MKSLITTAGGRLIGVGLAVSLVLLGCGKQDATPKEKNLLENPSFEAVSDGVPKGWEILDFRGVKEGSATATSGVTESVSYAGKRSFYLSADSTTTRFLTLSQKVAVKDVTRVRIRGALKSRGVRYRRGQYPNAGFAVTYFDENDRRFAESRFANQRTDPAIGTTEGWVLHDETYRLPTGTAYVMFSCILSMEGAVWFDDVSLEIPPGLGWVKQETKNFTFYWLPERELPEEAIMLQQQLYEYYAGGLGIGEEDRERVSYYFYPDSATICQELGIKEPFFVSWGAREIHTTKATDNHEIVHLITEPFGRLPRALGEGTAYYLLGIFNGRYIQPLAKELLEQNKLPPLRAMVDANQFPHLDPYHVIPAAASFVGYLIEFAGAERFLKLHSEAHGAITYAGFAAGFERVYGKKLDEVERHWRAVLRASEFQAPAEEQQP